MKLDSLVKEFIPGYKAVVLTRRAMFHHVSLPALQSFPFQGSVRNDFVSYRLHEPLPLPERKLLLPRLHVSRF